MFSWMGGSKAGIANCGALRYGPIVYCHTFRSRVSSDGQEYLRVGRGDCLLSRSGGILMQDQAIWLLQSPMARSHSSHTTVTAMGGQPVELASECPHRPVADGGLPPRIPNGQATGTLRAIWGGEVTKPNTKRLLITANHMKYPLIVDTPAPASAVDRIGSIKRRDDDDSAAWAGTISTSQGLGYLRVLLNQ